MINLCWCAETQGEWEAALAFGDEGVAIALGSKHVEMEAEGHLWLGHTWLGLSKPEQALAAFQSSLELRRELGQEYLAMGVLAGMSQAAMAQSDLDLALNYVEEILAYLDGGGSLGATWEPYRIYLSCYRVLHLAQVTRAGEILEIAYQELRERADKIPHSETRRMYLENVPWHAEIVSIYRETPLS